MKARQVMPLVLCIPMILVAAACSPFYGERDPYGRGAYGNQVSTVEVERALEVNEHVDADDIRVETRGDVVYLSGIVASNHQADEAYRAARSVRGVREVVTDRLEVKHRGRHG